MQGFTLVELLVLLTVIAVLVGLAIVPVEPVLVKGQLVSSMSNARQIYIATFNMANDGVANKDLGLGWPGDLKARGRIATFEDYVNVLVRNDYLKPGDLKMFSAPGTKAYRGGTLSSGSNGVLTPAFTEEYNAFKVYLVKGDDPGDTLFLATKNYTYNTPLNDPHAAPYGDNGFVVLRKGGDAAILKKAQAQTLSVVGKLPGGGSVESAENCLNPGVPAPQLR